jgi:hypothetical protein
MIFVRSHSFYLFVWLIYLIGAKQSSCAQQDVDSLPSGVSFSRVSGARRLPRRLTAQGVEGVCPRCCCGEASGMPFKSPTAIAANENQLYLAIKYIED